MSYSEDVTNYIRHIQDVFIGGTEHEKGFWPRQLITLLKAFNQLSLAGVL